MNAVNEQEPVSPQNAVLLLVDEQEGLFDRIHQPEQTRSTLVALARCARLLGIPAVMTTALAAGPNGPQLQELTETFAGQEVIDRTLVNAWHDRRARDAVVATGTVRRKLLIAGTGLDVCAQLPALASAADGYQPYVVDACGRFEPQPSVATVSRLTQAGVALVNTRVVVLEAIADNAHPKAKEIYATLPAGLVTMEMPAGSSRRCQESALRPTRPGRTARPSRPPANARRRSALPSYSAAAADGGPPGSPAGASSRSRWRSMSAPDSRTHHQPQSSRARVAKIGGLPSRFPLPSRSPSQRLQPGSCEFRNRSREAVGGRRGFRTPTSSMSS